MFSQATKAAQQDCNFTFVCSPSTIEGSRFFVCARVNTFRRKNLIDYFSVIKLDAKQNAIQFHTSFFANYTVRVEYFFYGFTNFRYKEKHDQFPVGRIFPNLNVDI